MSKFYFYLRRGHTLYSDSIGARCKTIDSAVSRARSVVRAVIRDDPLVPRSDQCIEIVDSDDVVVGIIPFELAFSSATRTGA